MNERHKEDKRFHWEEVKNERGMGANISSEGNQVKDVEGWMLREKEAVKGRWK